jgi:DNA polymerase
VRRWRTLPETALIPDLLANASGRVARMVEPPANFGHSAREFLPTDRSIASLRAAARDCQGCELCCNATQTVFGEGPTPAPLMFVGEQPGDSEDLAGQPFVGPAGQVFDDALALAGLRREEVYVTNAVKHFRFLFRGKRRIHNKPSIQHAIACHPWLEAELAVVQPRVLVCLGATAAQALIGPDFRITRQRGLVLATSACAATIATYHPSAVLRGRDASHREDIRRALVHDLTRARECLSDVESQNPG